MRVHYNTVEGLGLYLTYLLISGLWLPWLSVVGGLTWIIGRAVYAIGYYQHPEKRITGAYIFHLAELILLIGTIGFVVQLLRS
jgi:glutathione S-transferase